jgi:hypothetical protein
MMEATTGFDLRLTVNRHGSQLDRGPQASYLLRRDVTSVRSVDPLVWMRPLELPPAPPAEGLWPALSGLFAAAHALDHADAVAVRITALEEDESPEGADTIEPALEKYDLLGYHIAPTTAAAQTVNGI